MAAWPGTPSCAYPRMTSPLAGMAFTPSGAQPSGSSLMDTARARRALQPVRPAARWRNVGNLLFRVAEQRTDPRSAARAPTTSGAGHPARRSTQPSARRGARPRMRCNGRAGQDDAKADRARHVSLNAEGAASTGETRDRGRSGRESFELCLSVAAPTVRPPTLFAAGDPAPRSIVCCDAAKPP